MMKAVIFDLDDTLYDQAQPFQRAVQEYLPVSDEEIEELYVTFRRYADAVFEKAATGEMSLEASHLYRLQETLKEKGIHVADEKALAIQAAYSRYQGQLVLDKRWYSLLEACQSAGIQLGIITNGPHQHQEKKIRSLGLQKWIDKDYILISGQVGMTKPSPSIFQLMEERLQLSASDLLYIGDSFENDVIGSKQAGWQCWWLNHRKRQPLTGAYLPDQTFSTVEELTRALRDLL